MPAPSKKNPTRDGWPDTVPPQLFGASFAFVVNAAVIESDLAEAVALSPFVREQLSAEACTREFVFSESSADSSAIAAFQSLLSGSAISVGRSERVLSGHFGNAPLESDLLGCSKAGIAPTLSWFVIERRADCDSADVSALSFEALDDLLLSASVKIKIESEDELLRLFLNFGSGHRFLLKHVQLGFLSAEGSSLLVDHLEIPPESIWQCASEVIRHPRLPLESVIISDFPAIFAEFRWKRFSLLWRGGGQGFRASRFHFRCHGHAHTLTVILDTKGNIFGGFTPVAWESSSHWTCKADYSQKNFFFTL
jgi:hypothetical protein